MTTKAKTKAAAHQLVIDHLDRELREAQYAVLKNKREINALVEKQKVLKKERHELTQLLFSLKVIP
jgi:hypothetical protein